MWCVILCCVACRCIVSRRIAPCCVVLGQIRAEDAVPAAITISNLGMYGVSAFTAMVTPPQVMVLSVGAIRRVPAFDAQGAVVAQSIMTLTLGSDHRVINGAQAATFLGAIAQWLQKVPS